MFGRPSGGLDLPIFKQYLHMSFGVKLKDEEAAELFRRYDRDGSGRVTMKEFLVQMMPPDYTPGVTQWAVKRQDEDRARELARKAAGPEKPYLDDLPAALRAHRKSMWTTEKLLAALRDRLMGRVRRPEDQYRLAYRLFSNPRNGVKPRDFQAKLQSLGFVVTDEDLRGLMKVIDADGSGTIDFNEMVKAVMGEDYAGERWYETRDKQIREEAAKNRWEEPVLQEMPKAYVPAKPSQDEMIEMIATKILSRTKRPEDQFREAYKMFGSPHDGILFPQFKMHMAKLGMVLSEEDALALFRRIDDNGTPQAACAGSCTV